MKSTARRSSILRLICCGSSMAVALNKCAELGVEPNVLVQWKKDVGAGDRAFKGTANPKYDKHESIKHELARV